MKAFEISNALGIDGLTLVERDEPQLGHGQVLVRVRSVSLNHRDLGIVKSAGAGSLRLPLIPCSDGAGEVMKIGSGITRFKPGDRVAGIYEKRLGVPRYSGTGFDQGRDFDPRPILPYEEPETRPPDGTQMQEKETKPNSLGKILTIAPLTGRWPVGGVS